MRLLIVGANGQLGRAVQAACGSHLDLTVWGRHDADISTPEVECKIAQLRPDVVINCAAWTNVDGAEKEVTPPLRSMPWAHCISPRRVHRLAPRWFISAPMRSSPAAPGRFYYEYEQPAPSSIYARSKAAGEVAASRILEQLYLVRVAWLFGPGGNNFPAKIVAAADRNGSLKVVDEEFGNPTYAPDVAKAIFQLLESGHFGVYHLVNQGYASRYQLAEATLQAAGRGHIPLSPIKLGDWPRPAPPPPHAVLVNQTAAALGITLRPWQEAVQEYAKAYLEKREL